MTEWSAMFGEVLMGSSVWFDFLIYLMKGSYTENLELLLLTKRNMKHQQRSEMVSVYTRIFVIGLIILDPVSLMACSTIYMRLASNLYPLSIDCWSATTTCSKNCWNSKNSIWSELWRFQSYGYLGGGFKEFLFSPLFGEDSHFD